MFSRIFINTSFEGIHCYPNAPDEVSYLRNPHRHIFYVYVEIDVFHDDREIEFIMFRHFIESCISNGNYDYNSCEMMINDLAAKIHEKYPDRNFDIRISEDGENGAIKKFFFAVI